jgi:hypothetical protein
MVVAMRNGNASRTRAGVRYAANTGWVSGLSLLAGVGVAALCRQTGDRAALIVLLVSMPAAAAITVLVPPTSDRARRRSAPRSRPDTNAPVSMSLDSTVHGKSHAHASVD